MIHTSAIRDRGEEKIQILSALQRQEFEVDDTPDPSPVYNEVQRWTNL